MRARRVGALNCAARAPFERAKAASPITRTRCARAPPSIVRFVLDSPRAPAPAVHWRKP